MDQDKILEKQNEKQLEKESTAKAGAVAAHAVADYYTGGSYEKIRNMPVVGGVAKAAEKQVGKRFANMPGSKRLGKAAKMLDDAGALDMADQATSMLGGKSPNKEDVAAINKRGKNQADFGKSFSRKSKEENTTSISGKDSLPKDGLNKDKEQLEKKKTNQTTNANQANKSNTLSALKNDKNNKSLNGLKAKIMKLKVN